MRLPQLPKRESSELNRRIRRWAESDELRLNANEFALELGLTKAAMWARLSRMGLSKPGAGPWGQR